MSLIAQDQTGLTLYLLASSADNLCEQLVPISGLTDPDCWTLWWYSLKYFFVEKVDFKKPADDKKACKITQ